MIYVMTDKKTGADFYMKSKSEAYSSDAYDCKKYETLSDALRDSEIWRNGHYSDGECLDYVMRSIEQLEGKIK